MISKIFELRDVATFVPVLAIQLGSEVDQERWLMARAGFGISTPDQKRYVVLCRINGGVDMAHSDPFDWGQNNRTYFIAHSYIEKHFDELSPGAVIDVEHILGEKSISKISERDEDMNGF